MKAVGRICLLWWLAVMPAFGGESELATRFGTVVVQRSTPDSPPDTLAVNGKTAFVAEWQYIGLYQSFALGATEVVLFGVNCGGTGCPNDDLGFLVLSTDQPPRTVVDENFFSYDGTVEPRLAGDRIVVDLGYAEGQRKIAEFDLTGILIRTEQREAEPMDDDGCRWLHEYALDECIQAKELDPACNDPRQYFSGVVERSLSALSNHPAFSMQKFETLCAAACASGAKVSFDEYRKAVCGGR